MLAVKHMAISFSSTLLKTKLFANAVHQIMIVSHLNDFVFLKIRKFCIKRKGKTVV